MQGQSVAWAWHDAGMTSDPDPHLLDRHRDAEQVALVRGLAAEVAARHGGDLTRMRRANGYSNATWVGDGIAVRIAQEPVDMAREVALVRALPPAVGYPEILEEGTTQGHGWIVTRQVPGRNLAEAWPTLPAATQRAAVDQLWDRARIVHEATPTLAASVPSHGGFVPASVEAATASVQRAGNALDLSEARRSRLLGLVEGYFRAAPMTRQVVDHGDLALMNALWDDGVTALLDFEYAVRAPVEIDLCRLVCEAGVTEEGELVGSEAGDAAVQIALREMDPVRGRALIHGAAVLDQLRDLDIWLGQDAGDEPAEQWRPGRLLLGLLDAEGGYLTPALVSRTP